MIFNYKYSWLLPNANVQTIKIFKDKMIYAFRDILASIFLILIYSISCFY